MYSRNISNLMLAGRIISASHVAFASTRVMATCAHGGQAVGIAAALCLRDGILPRDLTAPARMGEFQRRLLRAGQFIPGVAHEDPADLAPAARITASSELALSGLDPCGETQPLSESRAMMLPVTAGPMPVISVTLDVTAATTLRVELRASSRVDNHTPDVVLKSLEIPLAPGRQQVVPLEFATDIDQSRYAFVCLLKNDDISVHLSDQRLTGVLALCQTGNKAVTKSSTQNPPPGIGIDRFEFWTPNRRPAGKNLAFRCEPPLRAFGAANLTNGISRPTRATNAWVADFSHEQPFVRLAWDSPQTIATIEIDFDTDFDHPMESVLMGHPERDMPFCLRDVKIACTPAGDSAVRSGPASTSTLCHKATQALAEVIGNHQSRRIITLGTPVTTDCLEVHVIVPSTTVPAALFAVRCYGP
jgi:FAD dependent oxidoreductase